MSPPSLFPAPFVHLRSASGAFALSFSTPFRYRAAITESCNSYSQMPVNRAELISTPKMLDRVASNSVTVSSKAEQKQSKQSLSTVSIVSIAFDSFARTIRDSCDSRFTIRDRNFSRGNCFRLVTRTKIPVRRLRSLIQFAMRLCRHRHVTIKVTVQHT